MIFSKGKYEKPARRVRKRSALLLLSLVLILAMSVGGTVAFLVTNTEGLTNTFNPGTISTDITEEFDGAVKKNVQVKNTGAVDAYVRARVVVNWVDKDGNVVPGDDVTISYNTSSDGWKKVGGFYYYQKPLAPGASTESLIQPITLGEKDGKKMEVTILSQAIQAAGGAVEEAWKGSGLKSTDAPAAN